MCTISEPTRPLTPHCSLALRQVYQGGEITGGRRVYVGNINYEIKEEDIKTEFSVVRLAHGRPSGCRLLCARSLSLRTLSRPDGSHLAQQYN